MRERLEEEKYYTKGEAFDMKQRTKEVQESQKLEQFRQLFSELGKDFHDHTDTLTDGMNSISIPNDNTDLGVNLSTVYSMKAMMKEIALFAGSQ